MTGLVLGWEWGQHKTAAVTDQVLTVLGRGCGLASWAGCFTLRVRVPLSYVAGHCSPVYPASYPQRATTQALEGGPDTSFSLHLELPFQPCPLSTVCPSPLGLRVMKVGTTQTHQPSRGSQDPP